MIETKSIVFEKVQLVGFDRPLSFDINIGELIYMDSSNRVCLSVIEAILGVNVKNADALTIMGEEILRSPETKSVIRSQIGYVRDTSKLRDDSTVIENVDFFLKTLGKEIDTAYVNNLLQELNLDGSKQVATLNQMEKYNLRIAIALSKKPDIVILYNPISYMQDGLFEKQMELFYNFLSAGNKTIIIATGKKDIAAQFPGRFITFN